LITFPLGAASAGAEQRNQSLRLNCRTDACDIQQFSRLPESRPESAPNDMPKLPGRTTRDHLTMSFLTEAGAGKQKRRDDGGF
jgi:hypothetical protein